MGDPRLFGRGLACLVLSAFPAAWPNVVLVRDPGDAAVDLPSVPRDARSDAGSRAGSHDGGGSATGLSFAEPFARECAVRRLAAAPPEDPEFWRERLAVSSWLERALVFDALARAIAAGAPVARADGRAGPRSLAEAIGEAWTAPEEGPSANAWSSLLCNGLVDEHPNVRAAALRAWSAIGLPLPRSEAERLARDVLPLVRIELANAWERCGILSSEEDERAEPWEDLCADADPRVRSAALRALAVRGRGAAQGRRLVALLEGREHRAFVRFLLDWEPQSRSLDRLDAIDAALGRARLAAEPEGIEETEEPEETGQPRTAGPQARRAQDLVELVRLRWSRPEPWNAPDAREVASAVPADAWRSALEAWMGLVGDGWCRRAEARELLLAASRRAPSRFAEGLARVLAESGSSATSWTTAARADACEALLANLGPRRALEVALEQPGFAAWPELLRKLAPRLSAWRLEDGERLLGIAPESALDAFETTFVRRADEGSAALLVRVLEGDDDALATRAFRALASPAGLRLAGPAVARAWGRLGAVEQRRRLSWLPREVPFVELRGALLARGARAGEPRRVAVELLSAFVGDDGVRRALAAWLAEDLATWMGGESPADARAGRLPRVLGDADRATLELWIQGELRALARVEAKASVADFTRALELSAGRSSEIGKLAAAGLAASAEGRRALSTALRARPTPEVPVVDARTRLEGALGLARRPHDDAERQRVVHALLLDHPQADGPLALRVLEALGRLGDAQGLRYLATLANRGPGTEGAEQGCAAVEALVRCGSPLAFELVEDVLRETPSGDARACLFSSLSDATPFVATEAFDERRIRTLERATAFVLAERPVTSEPDVPSEATERWQHLVRLASLAWADVAAAPPEVLEQRWLDRALQEAAEHWYARTRASGVTRAPYDARTEVALSRALARADRLEHALRGAGGVPHAWLTLDPLVCAALAHAAQRAAQETFGDEPPEGVETAIEGLVRCSLLGCLGVALGGFDADTRDEAACLARARAQLLRDAGRAGRWASVARLADDLCAQRRRGTVKERVWEEILGRFDRDRGVDPEARLASLGDQARARSALARNDVSAARAWLDRAGLRLGASRAAREAQDAIERELSAAGGGGSDPGVEDRQGGGPPALGETPR